MFNILVMKKNIPLQKEGGATDAVSEKTFATEKQAKSHFQVVKQRLLAINHWHKLGGEEKAKFTLFDAKGDAIERPPMIGDYIRIDIPGPLNKSGDGFDWVRIEAFEEDEEMHEEFVNIRVRPANNPQSKEPVTAHFFDDVATSSFLIRRAHTKISTEVHGRNEKPNIEDVNFVEKVRNTFVALGGIFGASKIQWKSFTEGLLT